MARLPLIVLSCVVAASSVACADAADLQTTVDNAASDAWTVSGFESTIELTESGLGGEIRIARVVLTESGRAFDDIGVACARIGLTTRGVTCGSATFTATIPGVGRQTMRGAFAYDKGTRTARIELDDVAIAGGRVRCDITASDAGIDVLVSGTRLQLAGLVQLAGAFTDVLAAYSASGLADISGTLHAPADGPLHIVLAADLDAAMLANAAGTVAADGVVGTLEFDVTLDTDTTSLALAFDSNRGEAYVEPVYANFSEHAVLLQAEDIRTSDLVEFDIGRFNLRQDAMLDASGSATLSLPQVDGEATGITAKVELRDSSVTNLYTSLVQVWLAGTVLGELDADGRISGSVSIVDNALHSATLQLDDVILDDRGGRFAVYGLQGAVDWHADDEESPDASRLRWDSGTVYSIIVGGGEADLRFGNDDIELLAPLELPAMGGALLINQFALHDYGSSGATGRLDAELEPIQLGQLTGAFGWPAFSGTLSGRLPLLRLEDNTISVGGTLSARAFDGTMQMSKLRIEQPFGRVPRLYGELAFRGLDLQRVTEAFSFGLIQGRLNGDIAGLEMQSWRPVAMDMHFYTPPDDRSQHRISQRAVENLASVGGGGGGAAAAMSTGFLQFFEVFAYDRIGLRCLLRDGACAMSGAGPAKAGAQGSGYYIVKGRGVPRIDVVGYRNEVSWPKLVQQLAAITRSGTPTVN